MHFIRLKPGRFTTRFARDSEAQRKPCRCENVAGIPAAGVPATIIPATPLGVIHQERGDGTTNKTSPPPLALPSRSRGVYFLHMYSCGKINATFDFPALRSFSGGGSARWHDLCDSVSQAKRVVNCIMYCHLKAPTLVNSFQRQPGRPYRPGMTRGGGHLNRPVHDLSKQLHNSRVGRRAAHQHNA